MAATALAEPRTRPDLDQLQGSWHTVAGHREARLLIAGRRFAFEFVGGEIFIGSFTLDTSTDPRRMDMLLEEANAEDRGKLAHCIYHVAGDVLRWCPTRPGSSRRLTGFPSLDDHRYFSMVFRLRQRQ
jgi:uncharacterized protein (TIGR03067 family)